MADGSAIEWTTATWNPTTGCDRISAGCDNCYALALARRLKAMGQPKYQNDGDPRTSGPGFAVTVHPDALSIPRRWREPRLVFVDSMSDFSDGRTILEWPSSQFRWYVGERSCVRHVSWSGWSGLIPAGREAWRPAVRSCVRTLWPRARPWSAAPGSSPRCVCPPGIPPIRLALPRACKRSFDRGLETR